MATQLTLPGLEAPSVVDNPGLQAVPELSRADLEQRLLRSGVVRIQLQRLAMRGLHASEAAKVLGISDTMARTHYADPEFRRVVMSKVDGAFAGTDAAFIERTKTMAERLEEQASRSFEELQKMLSPDSFDGIRISDNLRFRIHTQFLDRHTESAPISRQQVKVDPMQLSVAAAAAREMDDLKVVPMVAPVRKQIA